MADFTPAKDRFSVPDHVTRWRQSDTSQELGGEESWNPEERINVDTPFSHARNEPSKADIKKGRGGGFKGGGIGGVDFYEENRGHEGSADPEMMHLVGEYNSRPKGDNRTFNQWLNDEPIPGGEKRERFGVRIDLRQVGYDTELYENVFLPLSKIWTDKKTEVKYIVGRNRDDDELVFRNKEVISVPVKIFNEVLENQVLKSGDRIRTRVGRPEKENPTRFAEALRNLRLGSGTFKGEDVSAEFPKGKEVDREGFHIGINRQNLGRKIESGRDRRSVERFWEHLTDAGRWENIDAIGFGVENRKISTVIMKLKDGTSITIPSYVFRSVFDGVKPYTDKFTGELTGFKFVNLNGESGFVEPHTPQGKLDGVMRKLNMNGVPFPDVRFFIGPYKKESPIPVELPKVSAYTTS